ncbi:MAG: hypothetical protein A3H42_00705 [Deltaproteobacteria bacterium RIFCSPLOWO2_02_FULL_46_8]|nr:MAG: hypothetical protein A3H42_00705 [Deltaproteobacteria bacterium RIFCSPLOWO2_02_FULL_46_8]
MIRKTDISSRKAYADFLEEATSKIERARFGVARVINKGQTALYWDLGRLIVDRQKQHAWGKSVVEKLAADLRRKFGASESFSARNLWFMRQFYLEYSEATSGDSKLKQPVSELDLEKLKQLVSEIPWGHNILIMQRVKLPVARLYYLETCLKFGWSRDMLLNQIKFRAFERSRKESLKHNNFAVTLPKPLAKRVDEILKSTYNLEFLGLKEDILERDFEASLIEHIKRVILELGYGFCFVGNQYRLTLGKNEYYIDLLFYHRFLKSLVAVELKTGKFKPEYAGKMDFYLNLLNEKEKMADDNPSIGLILCAERDHLEVEFALKTKTNPIGVAEYKLYKSLPRRLKGKLPTAKQLTAQLKRKNNL